MGPILQVEVVSLLCVLVVEGRGCSYTELFQAIMAEDVFYHPGLGERKSKIVEEFLK